MLFSQPDMLFSNVGFYSPAATRVFRLRERPFRLGEEARGLVGGWQNDFCDFVFWSIFGRHNFYSSPYIFFITFRRVNYFFSPGSIVYFFTFSFISSPHPPHEISYSRSLK